MAERPDSGRNSDTMCKGEFAALPRAYPDGTDWQDAKA